MKPDVDKLPIVPDAPPAAGPDRALDPPPPAPVALDGVALDGVVLDDAADEPPQAASASTATNMPARTPLRTLSSLMH